MKVTILSIVAPPDAVSTAELVGEVAADLAAAGHEVNVLSTAPHYNVVERLRRKQPIRWRRSSVFGRSKFEGAEVLHARMLSKAHSRVGRVTQWAYFHAAVAVHLLHSTADAIFVVSPPPSLALVAARAAVGRRRVVLAVWELYPDILATLGHIERESSGFRLLRRLEGATYRACDHVTFLSAGMRAQALASHPGLAERSSVLATWADTDRLTPGPRPSALRVALELDDQFVVGYGGNLGPAQDLGILIEAARILKGSAPRIHVLICGSGSEDAELRASAEDLSNVTFTGQLDSEQVSDMYSTFDCSVVALAQKVAGEALPSKVYRSLACGLPLLAITDQGSPLDQLVRTFDVGVSSPPGDPAKLAQTILSLAEYGPITNVQHHVREVATTHFGRRSATARIEQLLKGAETHYQAERTVGRGSLGVYDTDPQTP